MFSRQRVALAAARAASLPSSTPTLELQLPRQQCEYNPGTALWDPNPASIEVLNPSTVPEESGVEKNLRAPDQAEGPYRTDCPQVNPG